MTRGTSTALIAIGLAVLGLLIGCIAVVAQQGEVGIGGLSLPAGLVLSLVSVACLFAAIRLLSVDGRGRLFVLAAAIGVVLPTAVFSLPSPGGSVLVPEGLSSTLWILIPSLSALVAIAWPERRLGSALRPADGER